MSFLSWINKNRLIQHFVFFCKLKPHKQKFTKCNCSTRAVEQTNWFEFIFSRTWLQVIFMKTNWNRYKNHFYLVGVLKTQLICVKTHFSLLRSMWTLVPQMKINLLFCMRLRLKKFGTWEIGETTLFKCSKF